MEPIIRRIFERVMNGARTLLGEETFAQVWQESRAATLEEIISCLRED